MTLDALEFATVITSAVLIVGAIAEATRLWLRHHDDDDTYTGRTKKP